MNTASRWRRAGALILDAFCILLGAWTVSCHIVVTAGGSLKAVMIVFSIACAVGVGITKVLDRTYRRSETQRFDTPIAAVMNPPESPYLRVGVLLTVCVSVILTVEENRPLLLWWSLAAILGFGAAWVTVKAQPAHPRIRTSQLQVLGLMALGLLCAGATLTMHRWDADDVFYVSLATSAADHPEMAILTHDVMHGIPDLPLHMELYRVHSWEMLMGAVSLLTPIPAIACFHWFAASIVAFLMPLAWARLFRTLVPTRWLWATAVLVLLLLLVGDAPRWFGSFGPARIWQGKAVFLSILLPLITAFGLEFGARPSLCRAARLTAAVIASVGVTVNALWLSPVVAVIAAVSAASHIGRGTAALVAGIGAASVYPVAIGLAFRARIEETAALATGETATTQSPEAWMSSLIGVFGSTELLCVAMVAMGSVWALLPNEPARRFAAYSSAAAWLTFLNPYAIDLVTKMAVGPVYWRTVWAVPYPALITLLLIVPTTWDRIDPRAGRILSATLVITLAIVVPGFGQFSRSDVSFHCPTLKVPPLEYDLACRISDRIAAGEIIVAPRKVGNLLPTMHDSPHPLEARRYLRAQTAHILEVDLKLRRQMIMVAEGQNRRPGANGRFREGLDRFGVTLVCLRIVGDEVGIHKTLVASGFTPDHAVEDYEIWIRDPGLPNTVAPDSEGDNG